MYDGVRGVIHSQNDGGRTAKMYEDYVGIQAVIGCRESFEQASTSSRSLVPFHRSDMLASWA